MKKRLKTWIDKIPNLLWLLPSVSDKPENNIVVTVSGGRSSMFQALALKFRYPWKNLIFIFANTGKEHEKTLEFIDKCDKFWGLGIIWVEALVHYKKGKGTEYIITNFENAKRNGEPFLEVILKYGLPSKLWRHCIRELKTKPINKLADDLFGIGNYVKAIGIRKDEPHRLTPKKGIFYPLAELGVTKNFILDWWARQEFDLEVNEEEGNCDLCFLKSKRKRMTVLKNNPERWTWWLDIEEVYSTERQPMFDVRNELTIAELIELSKTDFIEFKADEIQENNFDLDLDIEFSCMCANT